MGTMVTECWLTEVVLRAGPGLQLDTSTASVAATSPPLRPYLPILLLLLVSMFQAVMMVMMSQMLSPMRPTPVKGQPYESGITPLGDTRRRFSVKFYLVAILFIVFDLETVLLIPWAVAMRELGWGGFAAASLFILVLTVGLVYEWKKGALRWN